MNLKKLTIWLAVILMTCCIAGLAEGESLDTAMLLQQSPPQGGSINPGVGMHNYAHGSQVSLTAVPKPGYQFVYWLGDVSDPTTSSTIAQLNSPKIIVAVFQRVEHDSLAFTERDTSSPNERLFAGGSYGTGGSVNAPSQYRRGGGGGGDTPDNPREPQEEEDPFPVPEPVPEPGTLILLGLGAIGLVRRNKYRKDSEK